MYIVGRRALLIKRIVRKGELLFSTLPLTVPWPLGCREE
jgi:hypothetical protein